MTDDPETRASNPHLARLLQQYARDLGQVTPSSNLDARIGALVAKGPQGFAPRPSFVRRRSATLWKYAAAAGFAVLAIGLGVFIGMKIEDSRERQLADHTARDATWPSADLAMWPSDSVSFKVPAEYSAQGTLVAVDPNSRNGSTRYWIDVVVSNDGTFRIERIVPADPEQKNGGHDGAAPHVQ